MKKSNFHGSELRGQHTTSRSKSYHGRFGRMFRMLPPLSGWTETTLSRLASLMFSENESGRLENDLIPAGYTYLGQFINHDITFDPVTELGKQIDPEGIHNIRSPRFDLDSLYDRGPLESPYLFGGQFTDYPDVLAPLKFRIEKLCDYTGTHPKKVAHHITEIVFEDYDLPRILNVITAPVEVGGNGANKEKYWRTRAIIADPRNDENVIISQLHLAFLLFHNRAVDAFKSAADSYKNDTLVASLFLEAQQLTRWMYQWLIINDYLPRIVGHYTVKDILTNGRRFYEWKKQPFMPVEFSAAAFRFGHSMVRPCYTLNDQIPDVPIFDSKNPVESLVGFKQRKRSWTIKWERFFGERPSENNKLQASMRIDTTLATGLTNLPNESFGEPSKIQVGENDQQNNDSPEQTDCDCCQKEINRNSLAVRNLLRGHALQLPSGQAVARAMDIPKELILDKESVFLKEVTEIGGGAETPLWYYVLKEAEVVENGSRLGPVGGRIVAEVLIGLFQGDPNSYYNQYPAWSPYESIFRDEINERFDMAQFLEIASRD